MSQTSQGLWIHCEQNLEFLTTHTKKNMRIINIILVTFKNRNRDAKSRLTSRQGNFCANSDLSAHCEAPAIFLKVLSTGCIKECNHRFGERPVPVVSVQVYLMFTRHLFCIVSSQRGKILSKVGFIFQNNSDCMTVL